MNKSLCLLGTEIKKLSQNARNLKEELKQGLDEETRRAVLKYVGLEKRKNQYRKKHAEKLFRTVLRATIS